jgi:putative ABC transport system permease protein
MTTAVRERPAPSAEGNKAAPARRAMARWGWRLFRREWRRQALVLALLIVAIAATTVGLGVASNASNLKADPTFGTSNTIVTLPGSDPRLAADIAAIRHRFRTAEVIGHRPIPIPGSVSTFDLRAENPNGPFGHVTVRLDSGRYPSDPGQVAVTSEVAKVFGLRVGSLWKEGGRTLHVVGLVENPLNLLDQFALVPPGQVNPLTSVSILVNASQQSLDSFRVPSGTGLNSATRGVSPKIQVETLVLVLSTLGLLFVGLMAVAGFTVMAGRRLRALGMLGSMGATDRHVRLVMLANGAAVGATAAIVGTLVGLAGWFAFVPKLRSISEHRVDPLALPWWAIAAAMVLTFVTAVAAAWWPARAAARVSVVAALSGRPPRPQPAHRFAALGGVLLGGGIILLAFADQRRPGFIIGGTAATAVGLLFLAPLAIRALALVGRRSSVSVRLALRDLVRYQARSGAALGAVTLAVAIAATIVISASAAQTPPVAGNLPADQLVLHLTSAVDDFQGVPSLSTGQRQEVTGDIDRLAAAIRASWILPLDEAYDPRSGTLSPQPGSTGQEGVQPGASAGGSGGYPTPALAKVTRMAKGEEVSFVATLYAATPVVLDHYGIPAAGVDPASDIVSSRSDLTGLQIFYPGDRGGPPRGASRGSPGGLPNGGSGITDPKIQIVHQLPTYTSDPGTLITTKAMRTLGLQPIPAAWLIQTHNPLTTAQIQTAKKAAASAGLYVETRTLQTSLAPLRDWSTAAGILLALGVLGMTVGLIRSETANDLRTLAATGASSTTRRTLTGATAGALALLGAILGTAGAYAALLAWHRSDLSPLGRVPIINLVVILAGLPVIATAAGWLLAGGEPPVIARRPLE